MLKLGWPAFERLDSVANTPSVLRIFQFRVGVSVASVFGME